ncbi:MAG: hypothetical protein ABIQ52_12480 [Vicinamibacterales bacterium]
MNEQIILTMIASAWYLGRGPGVAVAVLFELTLDSYAWYPKNPYRFVVVALNRIFLFGSLVLFASARRTAAVRLREQGARLEATLAADGRHRDARHPGDWPQCAGPGQDRRRCAELLRHGARRIAVSHLRSGPQA